MASEFKPFEAALEGPAVFPDVVYIKITDGKEAIIQLNKVLAKPLKGMVINGKFEGDHMIPHVTLATFTAQNLGRLLAEVDKARRQEIGRMTVNQLVVAKAFLYRYFGTPFGRAHAFEKIGIFPLKAS